MDFCYILWQFGEKHIVITIISISTVHTHTNSPSVDNMEFQHFGLEEEDEDDAALQFMIEQSLLDSNKQRETHKESRAPPHKSEHCTDSSLIFTAVRAGEEEPHKASALNHVLYPLEV